MTVYPSHLSNNSPVSKTAHECSFAANGFNALAGMQCKPLHDKLIRKTAGAAERYQRQKAGPWTTPRAPNLNRGQPSYNSTLITEVPPAVCMNEFVCVCSQMVHNVYRCCQADRTLYFEACLKIWSATEYYTKAISFGFRRARSCSSSWKSKASVQEPFLICKSADLQPAPVFLSE